MTEAKNLSHAQIISLIAEDGLNLKAEILKEVINKTAFLRDIGGEKLYILQKENYYKQFTDVMKIDTELKCIVTLIIENSVQKLKKAEKKGLKERYTKSFKLIFKNSFVASIMPQLKKILLEDEYGPFVKSLDKSLYEIHFLNGYIDMKTNTFFARDIKLKPVTYVIPRNYFEPSKEAIDMVTVTFKKIMPDVEDFHILMLIIALALTGDSVKDQTALFFLGDGSNGKSLLMKCLQIAFCEYVQVLDKQTFEKGYSKQEKILNQFLINTYIRIANINEFSDRPIDLTIFKNFCDGSITTTSLFKDGQNTIEHTAKAFNAMNMFPKLLKDGGSVRRVDAITGKSLFVDDIKDVDESKHIYLKDKELIKRYQASDDILNAIVHVVCIYSNKLANGETIDTSKNSNMKKTRDEILLSNDNMTDFVDSKLIITNNVDDKISKSDMQKLYKSFNEKSLITLQQLISALKQTEKKIEYNSNIRNSDNTRGAFIGVCKKNEDEEDVTIKDFSKMKHKVEYQADQIKYLIKLLNKHNIPIDNKELELFKEEQNILHTPNYIPEVKEPTIETTVQVEEPKVETEEVVQQSCLFVKKKNVEKVPTKKKATAKVKTPIDTTDYEAYDESKNPFQ